MKRLVLWIGLGLLAVGAVAPALAALPGLVRVSSTYQDLDSPTATQTYQGYGILVQDGGRMLVVTASHLSAGDVPNSLQLFDLATGRMLVMVARHHLDVLNDVEAIEVEAPASVPFAEYHSGGAVAAFFPHGILRASPQLVSVWADVKRSELVHLGGQAWMPRSSLLPATFKALENPLDGTETELRLFAALVPGMSGLPVLVEDPQAGTFVTGLVTSSSRGFQRSWLARDAHIARLLRRGGRALVAERSVVLPGSPPLRWQSRQGLLYRQGMVVDGKESPLFEIHEALFEREPRGNGVRADGGGAVRTEGAAGLASTAPPALVRVMGFRRDSTAKVQRVVGFRAFHEKDRYFYLLGADMSTMAWLTTAIRDTGEVRSYNLHEILEGDALTPHMWARWLYLMQEDVHSYMYPRSFAWWGHKNKFRCGLASQARGHDGRNCSITLAYARGTGDLSVTIGLPHDELDFVLDERGRILGGEQKEFAPEVIVKSRRHGEQYRVELPGFLLTSPSSYRFQDVRPLVAGSVSSWNPQIHFHVRGDRGEWVIY